MYYKDKPAAHHLLLIIRDFKAGLNFTETILLSSNLQNIGNNTVKIPDAESIKKTRTET